jgi:hypothetical protein
MARLIKTSGNTDRIGMTILKLCTRNAGRRALAQVVWKRKTTEEKLNLDRFLDADRDA